MLELEVQNATRETDEIAEQKFEMFEIGKIRPKSDSRALALYLLKERKYGVMIYYDGAIEVFGYDPNEPDWE